MSPASLQSYVQVMDRRCILESFFRLLFEGLMRIHSGLDRYVRYLLPVEVELQSRDVYDIRQELLRGITAVGSFVDVLGENLIRFVELVGLLAAALICTVLE